MEFSPTTDSNNGTFALFQAIGNTKYRSKGTTLQDANLTIPTPPDQYVLTGLGDISGDSAILRKDGVQVASNTGDQGTGNYGAYQLFIGARSPASLSALGDFYGAIVRFGPALTTQELDDAEAWMDDLRNP